MDPMMLSSVLKHYKRQSVQQAIVDCAEHKEAVGSYGGKGYGRRPDVLVYPNDVMMLVKNGVTSFHVSEELWSNPQMIDVKMKKHEYNELRRGWDLVLDIDCPYWEFAKITTWLFVKALSEHGIDAITVKFSGNKGFHIGVPFEAFPEKIGDTETKDLFPEGPRKIATYLLDHIANKHVSVDADKITFGGKFEYGIGELASKSGKDMSELIDRRCANCGKSEEEGKKQLQFVCSKCESVIIGLESDSYKTCEKCNTLMERSVIDISKACCTKKNVLNFFNPMSIVEVDTVLIAPRHLYRAPYSYHEKSGRISIPIDPNSILDFDKESARPENVVVGKHPFIERTGIVPDQATNLLKEAFDHCARKEQSAKEREESNNIFKDSTREFEAVQNAIPESFFPPCIQAISKGLTDGRKRAVFILINFLTSCGWDHDSVEEWLKRWNERHSEPLRDQYYLGQLRYTKQQKKKILPPNCDNLGYYKSFGVCNPDPFCRYIKNPVNYAIRRSRYSQKDNKTKATGTKDAKMGAELVDEQPLQQPKSL